MSNRRILVVEDDPLVRVVTVTLLEDRGYYVLEARNGADALKILETTSNVGLLITDIHMPGGIDGVMLASRVCRDWPAIGIVVVSGKGLSGRGLPSGVAYFDSALRS